MEMMNQGLLWLADNLRVTYGGALLDLAAMIVRASMRYTLRVAGRSLPAMDPGAVLSLRWPQWYPPSANERQLDATTITTLMNAGLLSKASAIKALAGTYDLTNISGELQQIAEERQDIAPDE